MEIALVVAGLSLVTGLTQIGVSHLLTKRREKEAAARAAEMARAAEERRAAAEREAEERRAQAEREAQLRGQIQVASFAEVREFGNVEQHEVLPNSPEGRVLRMEEGASFRSRSVGAYLVLAGLLILFGVGVWLAIEAIF